MYELKQVRICSGYTEANRHVVQLAVGDDVGSLRDRWNAHVASEAKKADNPDEKHKIVLPVEMAENELCTKHTDSNGSGWFSVSYCTSIVPLEQFDDELTKAGLG